MAKKIIKPTLEGYTFKFFGWGNRTSLAVEQVTKGIPIATFTRDEIKEKMRGEKFVKMNATAQEIMDELEGEQDVSHN